MKRVRLIDLDAGASVMLFDDGLPPAIVLPNGDHVCGAKPGDSFGKYLLEEYGEELPAKLSVEERLAKLEKEVERLLILVNQ